MGNLFAGEKIVAYTVCLCRIVGLSKCSCRLSLDFCVELSG
jgi:hypothetical protein